MRLPEPLYLDDGSFALFHAPERELSPRVAVVVCPTIGYEAICSHRTLRVLAEELARRGSGVVRLDYHGTGDSAGHDRDPGRVSAWSASIDAAIEEAKRRTGARDVVLVGLRLGANLAGKVAARRKDVAGIVLFAPCASGRSFVRETRAFRLLAAANEGYAAPAESDELDAAGFVLSNETLSALTRELTWPRERLAPRVLLVEREDVKADAKLVEGLRASGASLEVEGAPGYSAMMVDPHRTVPPRAAIERIATFVESTRTESASGAPVDVPTSTPTPVLRGEGFEERARWFGRRIFGIVTEPTAGTPRATIVLLNPGSVHHVGSNRMHVTWARRWALAGYSVARIDVGGIGESLASPGQPENETYSTSAVPDIELVSRELGGNRTILVGLCSGAYAAYHTALSGRPRPRAVVLINPQTFHFQKGDSLEVSPLAETRRYKASMLDPSKWRRVLAGQVDLRNAAKVLASRALLEVTTRLGRRFGGPNVSRELHSIVAGGTHVLLVYSATDPGLDYLAMHARGALDELRPKPGFKLEIVQDADHTFTLVDAQRRLETLLTGHLERLAR